MAGMIDPSKKSEAGTSAGPLWEQRWHPLREEWVVIAAHRNDRPWTGDTVQPTTETVPTYGNKSAARANE
jgi:hypothetical protein